MKKIIYNIMLMILFTSLLSCNKESVIIPEAQQTINGKIYNQLHEAMPNITVKIDEQSTVTSSDGNFILNNVNTPYDLILFDSLKNSGYFFKGLTLANPEINVIKVPSAALDLFLRLRPEAD